MLHPDRDGKEWRGMKEHVWNARVKLPLAVTVPAWDHLRLPMVEEVSHCDGFMDRASTSRLLLFYPQHTLIMMYHAICDV